MIIGTTYYHNSGCGYMQLKQITGTSKERIYVLHDNFGRVFYYNDSDMKYLKAHSKERSEQ